jgi:hypothetical protein
MRDSVWRLRGYGEGTDAGYVAMFVHYDDFRIISLQLDISAHFGTNDFD